MKQYHDNRKSRHDMTRAFRCCPTRCEMRDDHNDDNDNDENDETEDGS